MPIFTKYPPLKNLLFQICSIGPIHTKYYSTMLGLVREKMLVKSHFCSVSQPRREGVMQQPEVCDSCLHLGKDYGRLLVDS